MKKYFGIFTAVLMIAAGCAKEIMPSVDGQYTILTAGVEATKTVLDGMKVYWTDGDRISVNGVTSDALSLETPSASAEFRLPGELNTPYKAVFPASIYKNETTVTMPSVQEYHESSFHSQASPMVAYSTTGNLSFSHPFSVVCVYINLSEDTDKISYVEFSGNDNEQVCGDFTVDYSAKTLAGAGANAANKAVRVNVGQSISAGTPMAVHIVVPARTYSKGFSVKVADEKGHYMVQSTSSEKVYAAGKVYDMTPFDFVPTDTELNVEITSADNLIAFAEAWNKGGTYGANTVVTLAQDITFSEDDNAAWPGIGSNENRFNGIFKGDGNTISGFTSTNSLFNITETSAVIDKIKLSGEVTYTLSTDNTESMRFSPLIAHNRAEVTGCVVDVDIYVTGEASAETYIGGIAAYMNSGNIRNCDMAGDVNVSADYLTTTDVFLGGIVGQVNSETASIQESEMSGTIQLLGDVQKNDVYLGGIVGYTHGVVQGCTMKGSPVATDGIHTSSILVSSDKVYRSQIGGIVGYAGSNAQITSCINESQVLTHIYRNGDASRYTYVAGIVGRNAGTITDCTSSQNAMVSVYSAEKDQAVGGIAGECTGSILRCINNSNIVIGNSGHDTNKAGRYPYVGGVVGIAQANVNIKEISNTGDVVVEIVENGQYANIHVGGCIGKNSAILQGENKIINSGDVTWNSTNAWEKTVKGINLGGVIGSTDASVSGLKNTGKVSMKETELYAELASNAGSNLYMGGIVGQITSSATVSSSLNEGEIGFDQSGELRKYTNICLGGVLGYNAPEVSVVIEDCDNKGYVYCLDIGDRANDENADKQGSKYLGGIVGFLQGASTVSNCVNDAVIHNADDNNSTTIGTAPVTGGIVGRVTGDSETKATISYCSIPQTKDLYLQASRGWVGGIVGYCEYGNVEHCTNNIPALTGAAYYYGGLCGHFNNSILNDSACNTQMTGLGANGTTKNIAGLAARCSNSGEINRCSYVGDIQSVAAANGKGAFVGYAEKTVTLTISECTVKGTIDEVAITDSNLEELSYGSKNKSAQITLTANRVVE